MWILLFTSVLVVAVGLGVLAVGMSPTGQDSSADGRIGPRQTACLDLHRKAIGFRISDDVRLLLRRMALLGLAPYRVNVTDPLLFRELQGRCSLCPSKIACARDLAHEVPGGDSGGWREYCPNAAALASLRGSLQPDLSLVAQAH